MGVDEIVRCLGLAITRTTKASARGRGELIWAMEKSEWPYETPPMGRFTALFQVKRNKRFPGRSPGIFYFW